MARVFEDEDDRAEDFPTCAWCDTPCEDDTYYPYCSVRCSIDAERDNADDV